MAIQLLLSSTGATFNPAKCDTSNVKFGGDPAAYGLSIKSVIPATRDSFLIVVQYDTIDFDVNQILTVNISPNAYVTGTATLTDTITIRALNDPESITLSWNDPPGTNGLEATMNNEIIHVKLNGGTLKTTKVGLPGKIWISGSAIPYGLSFDSLTSITKTSFLMHVNWDGTHYNHDKTLTVHVDTSAYYAHTGILSSSITLPATIDLAVLHLSWANPPGTNGVERYMNSEVLHVDLTGGSFFASKLTPAHVKLAGDAVTTAGITMRNIANAKQFSFDINLAWDETDYDVNKTLQVQIDTAAYRDDTSLLKATQPIIATIEKVKAEGNWINNNLQTFYQLGLDTIMLHLIGASWLPADSDNKYLSSHIDTLFNGIRNISGSNNQPVIQAGLETDTLASGYNNAIYRLNDTILVIAIPPLPDLTVKNSETFNFYISPKLLVGTKGGIMSDIITINEASQISATLTPISDSICNDGHSTATITVALGGKPPWNLVLSTEEENPLTGKALWNRRFLNLQNAIFTFEIDTAGTLQIDTLEDGNHFILVNGDVQFSGHPKIKILPLPSVSFNGLRTNFSKDEDPADITATGVPSITANPSLNYYSGNGILFQNNKYYFWGSAAWKLTAPPAGTTNISIPITYHYTDPKTGCSNTAISTVKVLTQNGTIDTGDSLAYYCYSHAPVLIIGTNTAGDTTGTFTIDGGADSALHYLRGDTAIIYPGKFPSTTNPFTITYTYHDASNVAYPVSKTITIEPKPTMSIPLAINPDTFLCANASNQAFYGSINSNSINGTYEFNDKYSAIAYDPVHKLLIIVRVPFIL